MHGLLGVKLAFLLLTDQFLLHKALLKKQNILVKLANHLAPLIVRLGVLLRDVIQPERCLSYCSQALLEQFDLLLLLYLLGFVVRVWF